ncbi:LysM peptidoglycan-binding domain-containing protein, partial [Latilactobacillus fuchuensis]
MTPLKTILFSTTLTAATAAGILFAGNGQASAATTYTVTTGDTLSSISNKFAGNNDLVDSIAKNNSISNINLIYVGEQ